MADAKVIITAQSELDKGLNKAKYQLQDFSKAASTVGNSISSIISKHAGIAALVGSVAALGAAAKKCADEYLGAARENDRFEATMKNLTKTTGVSAREVQSLADKYEILTFHTAEQIQAAGQLLLATGEISKEAFPRALEATMDLAEAMGQDLSSAASSLQKALAEPESGLKALRTAGINFSDSEEELIKSLIESNKKLEAQELILQKVEERYAGVAKAVADTPVGKLDAIKDTWGALKENIGEGIINSLDDVFSWILTQLEAIRDFFDERNDKKEMQRITAEGVSDISEYGNAKTYLTENKDLLKALADLRNTIKPIANANDFYLSVEDEDLIDAISEQFGVNIKFDSLTGTIEEMLVESVAKAVSNYEKDNPETLFLTHTYEELEAMLNELEASDAQRDKLLATLTAHPRDYNADTIAKLETEEKIYEYLKEHLPDFNSSGNSGSGDSGNDDSGDEPPTSVDLTLQNEAQKGWANHQKQLYKDAKKAGDAWREVQSTIDETIGYLDEMLLSTMDEYDREIYGIVERINDLSKIDASSPLKEQANGLIEVLSKEIDRIRREQAAYELAEKEKKDTATKSEQVKDITSDVKPAETEEDIYGLFLKLDELAKLGTEEASEAMVRINGYIADFYNDLDEAEIERLEEEKKRRKAASNIWDDKGFRGMEEIFETLEDEMSMDDVLGGFFAEFGRTRELGVDSLFGSLDSILGALDPLLDILLSADPVLAIIMKILESFAEVIGSAISTTIAPFFDFLDEFGTLLGEVFLPIFDSLYPVINMITEMLRMFFVPALQFLEPIINTLTIAFDALAGIVAIVGAVLTPVAATIEFIMDIFGYFGEVMLTAGENIGIAFYNLTHWFDTKEFKQAPEFHSDAFDNLGEKMDKWFHMMEDDQVVSDSVSQQIATSNATYTGAVTVHLNVYQNAPVVGEDGMTQFAMMIRDKFEELDYYAA